MIILSISRVIYRINKGTDMITLSISKDIYFIVDSHVSLSKQFDIFHLYCSQAIHTLNIHLTFNLMHILN